MYILRLFRTHQNHTLQKRHFFLVCQKKWDIIIVGAGQQFTFPHFYNFQSHIPWHPQNSSAYSDESTPTNTPCHVHILLVFVAKDGICLHIHHPWSKSLVRVWQFSLLSPRPFGSCSITISGIVMHRSPFYPLEKYLRMYVYMHEETLEFESIQLSPSFSTYHV